MMLNSYVPNGYGRYALVGLAIITTVVLVMFTGAFIGETVMKAGDVASVVGFMGVVVVFVPLTLSVVVVFFLDAGDDQFEEMQERPYNTAFHKKAAYHDSLTGLRNRLALSEDFARIVKSGSKASLFLFDLDRFKFINDTMGHHVGDSVLKTLAMRLGRYCSDTRFAYRLGGDEFVVVWVGQEDERVLAQFCEDLIEAVFCPINLETNRIDTAGSIGIAMCGDMFAGGDEISLSVMLKRADLALYRAKSCSGSSFTFFTDEMETEYLERVKLEKAMREGVVEGTFEVDYLPVYSTETFAPSGFFAQIHWQRAEDANFNHDDLFSMAENNGLIVFIGKWLLQRVLADVASWDDKAEVTLPVSSLQLRDPLFAPSVLSALSDNHVAAQRLIIDVRSNSSIDQCPIALSNFELLREAGVEISVSEFAASVAGLSMIRPYPVNRVHLDLASIKAIAGPAQSNQVLDLFLQLATTVGTCVILSGIENFEDFENACAVGATQLQGSYIGLPLSSQSATQLFSAQACLLKPKTGTRNPGAPDVNSLTRLLKVS